MWLKTMQYEVRRKTTGQVLFTAATYEDAMEWMKGHRSVELVVHLILERGVA